MVMADIGTSTDLAARRKGELAAYRARQTRAFAAARKHSRLVRFLRRAIPVGCLVVLTGLVLFSFFNPFKKALPNISVSTVGIAGSKITMQAPKLSGYKKDLRSYDVTADTAVQDVKKPTVIELLKPDAKIELEKERFARVTANTGIYDSTAEKMNLDGNVKVKTDTGYDVQMSDARLDLKAGNISTDKPVKVKMSSGTIDADSMEVLDSGKSILFRGHVVHWLNAVDTDTSRLTESGGAAPAPPSETDKKQP